MDLDEHAESYADEIEKIGKLFEGMRTEAASENDRREKPERETAIDTRRTSKAVLVDGPRGSGKTTLLLLTLRRLTPLADATKSDGGRVHSLGLLDLEVLSENIPLVIHVLTRLRSAFDAHEGDQERGRLAWTDDIQDHYQKVLDAVGRGWRNNLDRRAPKLEPADYSWAMEIAANANMDHKRAFQVFMDALVELYQEVLAGADVEPLFVIAIDDADMQPERSPEVLHLVRALWHPNLAFLLAGDDRMFLRGLELSFHKRLSIDGTRLMYFDETMTSHLALEALEKAIPRRQRFRRGLSLGTWRWGELRKRLAARGLNLGEDAELLVKVQPAVTAALPPHHRELNQMCEDIVAAVEKRTKRLRRNKKKIVPANENDVSIDELAPILWRTAVERREVPPELMESLPENVSEYPKENRRAWEHLVSYPHTHEPTDGICLRDVLRPEVRLRARTDVAGRAWPETSRSRGAAAFRWQAFNSTELLGRTERSGATTGRVVAARVPEPLAAGVSLWVELVPWGLRPMAMLILTERVERRLRDRRRVRGGAAGGDPRPAPSNSRARWSTSDARLCLRLDQVSWSRAREHLEPRPDTSWSSRIRSRIRAIRGRSERSVSTDSESCEYQAVRRSGGRCQAAKALTCCRCARRGTGPRRRGRIA